VGPSPTAQIAAPKLSDSTQAGPLEDTIVVTSPLYRYALSTRGGRMQLWRMNSDGKAQEQMTDDEFNNWFAHPSPDGRLLVFVSFEKDVTGHPENKDVTLRMMNLANKEIGNKLNISERTVKFHVSNLLNKFGVRRRADLILLCYQKRSATS
jgi:DNA-binding CsgD family transcriptional regulator